MPLTGRPSPAVVRMLVEFLHHPAGTTLRGRIAALATVIAGAVLALFGAGSYVVIEHLSVEAVDARLHARAAAPQARLQQRLDALREASVAPLAEPPLAALFAEAVPAPGAQHAYTLRDAAGEELARVGPRFEAPVRGVSLRVDGDDGAALLLGVETPARAAFAPLHGLAVFYLVAGALGLWVVARIAMHAGEALTRPLRLLGALVCDIEHGGARECALAGEDEVATLSRAINRMVHTLCRQREALEARVREHGSALEETRARLSGVLDVIPEVVYSATAELDQTLYVSPAARGLLGRPAEAAVPGLADLHARIHAEDREAHAAMLADLREHGAGELRYRLEGEDGTLRWVCERARLLRDLSGRPCRIDGLLSDVTDREVAETARREAERGLRLKEHALASSRNGVLILSVAAGNEQRVVHVNRAFHELFGYSEAETLGADWRFLLHASPDAEAVERVAGAVAARTDCRLTLRVRRKDGTPRWIDLGLAPVDGPDCVGVDHLLCVFNDIHERVLTEQRYRNVVETVREVIFQADAEGRWTFLNPAWERLTGHPVDESLGRPFLEFVHPGDRARNLALFEPMARGDKETCEHEVRYLNRDGSVRWVQVFARASRDADGAPAGFTGTLIDITERRQWEEELHLRDRALQASSNGIVIVDMTRDEQPIIFANRAFEHITGYGADEVLGRNCRFLQCEQTDPAVLDTLREAIRDERACQVVLRNRRRDGTLFWNQLSVSPVREPASGRVTHFVGAQTDVTDKLDAERQLFEWYVRLNTILTLSPDGFVFFDSTGHIAYVNPAFERMVDIPSGALEGRDEVAFDALLRELCDPARPYLSVFDALPAQADDADAEVSQTLCLRSPHGRVLQRSVRQCHSDAATRVYYFRDVTRETEVDRLKSEFLSITAHELRTPMAGIMGFSELLLSRDYDEARRRELLETINRQSVRLTALLGELLDLARIEARAGKDFHRTPCDLGRLIDETLAALMVPGDARRVEVRLPAAPMPELMIDAGKMQQALTNVLSNAYKYSPGGGTIRLEVLDRTDCRRIGLRVSDQGIGMTRAHCERAFERFWRADDSGAIPGTGLGLSLVKEIVELHGGRVELHSTPGHGTSITLWLPLSAEADAPAIAQCLP